MSDYKEKWESLWEIYKDMKDEWHKAEALAASRLELLREAKDAIEHGYYSRTLLERIEKELGE